MSEFASYQPGAWRDEYGLVHSAPPRSSRPGVPRQGAWVAMLVVPLIGVGVATGGELSFRLPESAAITSVRSVALPVERSEASQQPLPASSVSPDYWPRLLQRMKTMRTVEEAEGPDPEPEW